MPKKKALPTTIDRAKEIYETKYKDAYASKVSVYPHIRALLWELSKVEAQLLTLEERDQAMQKKGEDIFLITDGKKLPFMHPNRKQEKELRSAQNKIVKSLNLSLDRKSAMKAETAGNLSKLVDEME